MIRKGVLQLLLVISNFSLVPNVAHADDTRICAPFTQGKVTLEKRGGRAFWLTGAMAPFDPCHPSVSFDTPSFFAPNLGEKPPVMVLIHGGTGLENYQKELARRWRGEGFATLVFDAFEMNGLDSKSTLVRYQLASASKQKMIFTVAMGAYQWLRTNPAIDPSRMFFQGLSQGGHVAANVAGASGPDQVKGVIAEGAPPYGIGFPDHIKVPLTMLYGERDVYGSEGTAMYKIQNPCWMGEHFPEAPSGYGAWCNAHTKPGDVNPTPLQWIEKIQSQGEPITLLMAQGGGHGVLLVDYSENKREVGGRTFYSSRGASPDVREDIWQKIKQFVVSKL